MNINIYIRTTMPMYSSSEYTMYVELTFVETKRIERG